MEKALVSVLLATAGVTALAGQRVYWVRGKTPLQAPYVIMTRAGGGADYTYQAPADLTESRVQITCFAATYSDAKALGAAIKARLSGYGAQIGGVLLSRLFLNAEMDLPYSDDDSIADLYGIALDFTIWHKGA